MTLRVTLYGESILRKKGARVETFDDNLRKLAADMVEAMHKEDGAGLAAQQVDKALQLFVVDLSGNERLDEMPFDLDGRHPPLSLLMPMVFINAKVTPLRGGMATADEGCLSFPDIRGDVERPDRIRCEYQDLDGAFHVIEASDWLARVIQHEYDHTVGVLFTDRMAAEIRRSIDSRLKRLRKVAREEVAKLASGGRE
jgi:peptide deformylase